jgi:uncharacterized protein
MKNFITRFILFAGVLYFGICLALYLFQEQLLFVPMKLSQDHVFSVPGVEEVFIDVPGARISALHYKNENPRGLIFFLHGNAGSLDNWLRSTAFYQKTNFDLFMIDYRGFGKSTGRIKSEEQLIRDVHASWKQVIGEYEDKLKIVYGRSLGTALAAELSLAVRPDMTILVSPYYSMHEMARLYYPWVPGFILRYPLDTAHYLEQIQNPVMIIHGDQDTIIPLEHSQRLTTVSENASLITIPGAMHDDIHNFKKYDATLRQALESM